MMKKFLIVGLILCAAIIAGIYFFPFSRGTPQKPQIIDITHTWGKVTIESTEIWTKVTVHNPNNFPIYFTKIEYTIYMNDVLMGAGSSEEDIIIRANSDKTIHLTTVIDNSKLAEWWVSHINNGEKTTFKFDGYVYFDLKITTFKYHIELEREIQTDILGGSTKITSPAAPPIPTPKIAPPSPTPKPIPKPSPTSIPTTPTPAPTATPKPATPIPTLAPPAPTPSPTVMPTPTPTSSPKRESLQIIIIPKPAKVGEEVTIKVVDSNLNPVKGAKVVYIKAAEAVITGNIITNGKYIGETDSNGEVRYVFKTPELYVIGATKLPEYYPAIEYLLVKLR